MHKMYICSILVRKNFKNPELIADEKSPMCVFLKKINKLVDANASNREKWMCFSVRRRMDLSDKYTDWQVQKYSRVDMAWLF